MCRILLFRRGRFLLFLRLQVEDVQPEGHDGWRGRDNFDCHELRIVCRGYEQDVGCVCVVKCFGTRQVCFRYCIAFVRKWLRESRRRDGVAFERVIGARPVVGSMSLNGRRRGCRRGLLRRIRQTFNE